MMRKNTLCVSLLGLWLVPASSYGFDAMKAALESLPSDAMGYVIVPSLKQLDADYQQAVKDFGLQAMVPPPYNSLLGAVKTMAPQLAGLDENGPAAIVLMPVTNVFEMNMNQVVVLPVTDPKAMLEGMNATAGEGGVWQLTFFGQPMFAVTGEKRVSLCRTSDVARKVAASKTGLPEKLKGHDLKTLSDLDIAMWLDGEALFKMLKPQIDAFMPMIMAMQSGAGQFGVKQAEATKKNIDLFVDGISTLAFGLAIDKSGIDLRVGWTTRPGSEMAKQSKVRTTRESLLKGLPGDGYIVAIGQLSDPAQAKSMIDSLDPYFSMLEAIEGLNKEKIGELKSALGEWAPLVTSTSVKLELLPSREFGILGICAVGETTDARKWMQVLEKMYNTGKGLVADAKAELIDEDVKKIVKAFSYQSEAETLGGAKVAHLKFDVNAVEELDDDEKEEMAKVLGKEGLTFRFAALESNQVVMTLGGGPAYMERLMASAGKKEAALESNAGIRKVAAAIPADRASVIYVAVDETIKAINAFMSAMDEDEIPVKVPAGTPPLTLSSTGGDEWMRMDLFLPTELIVAGKNAVMTLTGSEG